jgi:hypothetical protein
MALDGTYETKLLRIVIGYLHVSLLQQIALTRHGKPFHSLDPQEKTTLEADMVAAVGHVAHQLTEETLKDELKIPSDIVH